MKNQRMSFMDGPFAPLQYVWTPWKSRLWKVANILKNNKNMRRKSVKSLKSRCFETLGPYVTKCIRKTVSNANSAEWYGMLHGNLNLTADYVITKQVTLLKNYLWSHIIWYDYDEMFKILLQSIENALHITRKSWSPTSNNAQYRQVRKVYLK